MYIIRFSYSVFQDYSRVGYDSCSVSHSIIPNGTKRDEDDFEAPEHFTLEQVKELAKKMQSYIESGYYSAGLAYKLALTDMGVKL